MGRAQIRRGTATFINLSLCMPLPVREKGLKVSPCSALTTLEAAVHQAGAQTETLHCTPQPGEVFLALPVQTGTEPPASLGASSPHIPPHRAQRALHAVGPPFQDIFSVTRQAHEEDGHCVPGITRGYEVDLKREREMHVPGMDTASAQGPARWTRCPA